MFVKSLDREEVAATLEALPRHTWMQSIAWHLLPGVPLAIAYLVLAYAFTQWLGWPNVYALFVVVTFVEIPLLYVLLKRLQPDAGPLLGSAELFPLRVRQPLRVWFGIAIPVAILSFGANMMVVGPIDDVVRHNLFGFLPDWFVLDFGASMAMREAAPLVSLIFFALSVVGFIIGSYMQELYFRGLLLPRMPDAGVGTAARQRGAVLGLSPDLAVGHRRPDGVSRTLVGDRLVAEVAESRHRHARRHGRHRRHAQRGVYVSELSSSASCMNCAALSASPAAR